MSFGFGVGDILVVSQLAWSTYKGCKSAPESFSHLAKEALALHAVLKETEDVLLECELSSQQRESLRLVCDPCRDVLSDLNKLVCKYESLGTHSRRTIDRVRWHAKDATDLRFRMISSTVLLSNWVNNSQAVIEHKLRKAVKEVQDYKRTSTKSEDSLTHEDRSYWRDIRKSMERSGITLHAFRAHKSFIINCLQDIAHTDHADEDLSLTLATAHEEEDTDVNSFEPETLARIETASSSTAPPSLWSCLSSSNTELTSPSTPSLLEFPSNPLGRKQRISHSRNPTASSIGSTTNLEFSDLSIGDGDYVYDQPSQHRSRPPGYLEVNFIAPRVSNSTFTIWHSNLVSSIPSSKNELAPVLRTLWLDLVDVFLLLIRSLRKTDTKFVNQDLSFALAESIILQIRRKSPGQLTPTEISYMQAIWRDRTTQNMVSHKRSAGAKENILYIYNNASRLLSADFMPNGEDTEHAKTRSTNLSGNMVTGLSGVFGILHASSPRALLEKRLNRFRDIDCLVFIIPLHFYHQYEAAPTTLIGSGAEPQNLMSRSLEFGGTLLCAQQYRSIPKVLILSGLDAFRALLVAEPMASHFSDFHTPLLSPSGFAPGTDSDSDVQRATCYFANRFSEYMNNGGSLHVHCTSAVRTTPILGSLDFLLDSVQDAVAKSNANQGIKRIPNLSQAFSTLDLGVHDLNIPGVQVMSQESSAVS